MSDKSLFYKSFEAGTEIDDFFEKLQEYAEESPSGNPVYILNNPLGDKKIFLFLRESSSDSCAKA